MTEGELEGRWAQVVAEVTSGFADWRAAHPRATFRELEAALDERWARARARLLEDAALASRAADLAGQPAAPGDGDGGSPGGIAAELRGLPGLWGGPFPPWMRNWNSGGSS